MATKTGSSRLVHRLACILVLSGLPVGAAIVVAEPIQVAAVNHPGPVDFQQEILPILRHSCLACHNATDAESDLVLETPASIRRGGSSGPAVVAGNGLESLLLQVAAHETEPVMPPEDNAVGAENLKPQQLGLLRLWMDQGAKGDLRAENSAIRWKPLPPGIHAVLALSLSSDGRYLATGRANQVVVYRVDGPVELTRLTDPALAEARSAADQGAAHLDIVQSLAFSPNAEWLASGGYRTVKLWRRGTDRLLDCQLQDAQVTAAVVSASGRFLVTGTESGILRIQDLSGDQRVAESLTTTHQPVTSLAISPDEQLVAAAGHDKKLRLWRLEGHDVLGQVELSSVANDLLFANDHTLAAACDDHQIHIWTMSTSDQRMIMAESHRLTGHSEPVNALAGWAADQLLSASGDGTVRLWNIKDAQQLRSLDHGAPVQSLAASPSTQRAVSGSATGGTKLWDMSQGKLLAELNVDLQRQQRADRSRLQLEIAERQVANATQDLAEGKQRNSQAAENLKKIQQQDASQNADTAQQAMQRAEAALVDAQQALEMLTAAVAASEEGRTAAEASFQRDEKSCNDFQHHAQLTSFAPQGHILATASETGCVYLWNADSGAALNQVEYDAESRRLLTFVSDDCVLTLMESGSVRQWAVSPHWELARVIGAPQDSSTFTDRITALAFSPDGRWLAVGSGEPSRSGQIKVFGVQDQQLWLELAEAHSDTVFGLAFSPDGKYLATCGADRFVKVFDAQTGQLVRTFEGHTHHVLDVAWQADGRILASAGADKAVKLWSFREGHQLRTIQDFGKGVTSLQFIGASNRFCASCGDHNLYRCNTEGAREAVGRGDDYLYCVTASQIGGQIAFGGHDGVVCIIDADGKLQSEIKPAPN